MAIHNPHILTVIRVDPVTVCHSQVVEDADRIHQHIPAACHMKGPEGAACKCDVPHGQVLYILHEDHGDPWIIGALDMVPYLLSIVDLLRSVNGSKACDPDIFSAPAIDEIVARLSVILTINIGRKASSCSTEPSGSWGSKGW